MADNKDYRSKVYGALKGELGDSFTKTEDEFNAALDSEEGYATKVYGALKGELGDSFNKEEQEFTSLIGLKKKEETTSYDFAELGKRLGESMSGRGKKIKEIESSQAKDEESELIKLANREQEETPRSFSLPQEEEQVPAQEEDTAQDFGVGTIPLETDRIQQPPIINREAVEQGERLAKVKQQREDKKIDELRAESIERAFTRSMQTAGRRGIPIEEGDIPTTKAELQLLSDAKENYNLELDMKMNKHIPQEMQTKALLVEKERDLFESLKSKEASNIDKIKAKEQIKAIQEELLDLDFSKKLFDPVTGETMDKDEATPEAAQYELNRSNKQKEWESDLQKAHNASDKVLHKYELYDKEYHSEVPGSAQGLTYHDILHPRKDMYMTGVTGEDKEKARELRENWLDAKADAEAISRAIKLNEDPAQIERGFGGDSGAWQNIGKGLAEGLGLEETVTDTEGEFATRYVDIVNESGEKGLLTKAQQENAKQVFSEKLFYGIGASLPIMGEIAITTAATEGVLSVASVASKVKKLKDLFGTSKAGKLFANTLEQGTKGYVTFAPTEESGATGIGEGAAQGILDTFLPEKLLGSKYGRLLNGAIRVVGGATGESIGEVSGQYFDALNENGYDARGAFYKAFGRTPEERWENLALIGSTSLLFSGAFNLPRLVMTQEALQKEIDDGNVPPNEVEAAQEIADAVGEKIESEQPKEEVKETKPKEDVQPTKKEEVQEVAKDEVSKQDEKDQLRLEEPATEQETRSTTDADIVEGKAEETDVLETEAVEKKQNTKVDTSEMPIVEDEKGNRFIKVKPSDKKGVSLYVKEGKDIYVDESGIYRPNETEKGNLAGIYMTDSSLKEPTTEEVETETEEAVVSKKEVKEAPKGKTLKYNRIKKGKPETITYKNVDTENVLYTDKNGNTLHKHDTGLVTLDSKGKVLSSKTTSRMEKDFVKSFDFSTGKKGQAQQGMTTDQADQSVVESSQNPQELAEIISRRKPQEAENIEVLKTTKEGAIAEILTQGSVHPDSYIRNTGLKRKDMSPGIPLHYLRKSGQPLDQIAMDAQEVMKGAPNQTEDIDGIEITEQDVVDFIEKYPNTRNDYYKEAGGDPIIAEAQSKFEELTGFKPTDNTIAQALGTQEAVVSEEVTKESILKDIEKLKESESTNKIFDKAQKEGLEGDADISAALTKKAQEFNAWNKKMNEQLFGEEFDADSDLPFQKGSRKQIADRAYLDKLLQKLKKAIPGLEFTFDESLDELGTIRDGKVIINPKKASVDTAIHEFAHLWVKVLKAKNSALYQTGISLVKKNKEIMDYVSATRPDLKTEEAIAEEALVTAIGEDGADFFNTREQQNKLQKIIRAIGDAIKKIFNIKRRITYAEMSEMSLKDFTKMASQELLNEIPLTKVTREDVENIMSEELILNTITIDSSILSDKGAATIGKAKETLGGLFMSQGKLPKWVADLDNNTKAALTGWTTRAARDVKIFNKALKEHIKENNLTDTQVDKLMKDIDNVFRDNKTSNLIALENFGMSVDLITATTAMRNNIDAMSKILLEGGYLTADLQARITENLGTYVTRSYEIHKKKPKSVKEWVNKLEKHTPEVLNKAKKFISEQYRLARVSKIHFVNKGDGMYEVVMENQYKHKSSKTMMSRADIIAVLQEGKPLMITDENFNMLDSDTDTITLDKSVDTKKYGVNFAIRDVDIDNTITEILTKHLSPEGVFGIAGMNKKDVSILKHRKDIPKEIRDLLGEIDDPAANYMETVSKMASLIEYSKFLERLKTEGEGTLIWSEENRPADAIPISRAKNPRWQPIDDMYTTEEFMSALQHYEKSSLLSLEGGGVAEQVNAFFLLLNTFTKASLTKWNIPSNFRNHWGAMMMAARMGYGNPVRLSMDFAKFATKKAGKGLEKATGKSVVSEKMQGVEYAERGFFKAYTDFYKGMSLKEQNDFDRAEFETMQKFDLISDNVGYNIYKDSVKQAMKTSSKMIDWVNKADKSKPGQIAKAPREFMDKVYLAPDAAAKMFLFRNMKIEYAEAYGVELAKPGETKSKAEEALEEKVANIIKDTLPTFSKMSKGAKFISRNPIFGAFASFTTETVRNYFNQIRLLKQLHTDYKKNPRPAMKKLINKNVTGLIGMSLIVPTIATALKMALDISDEDEEKLKSNAPEWEKNSWTLYLGKGKDGSIIGVDLSYVDPLSVMSKPMYAFIAALEKEDGGLVDATFKALEEAKNQFFGDEPLFKAITEAYISEEDRYGRNIGQPFESGLERQYDKATHVLGTMMPRVIDNFIDAKKAYIDENVKEDEAFGKKYNPMTYTFSLLGFGIRDRDVLRSAKFNISGDFRQDKYENVYDAKNIYKYGEKTPENLDKSNAELAGIFNRHMMNLGGARVAGATDEQIRESLNERSEKTGRRHIPSYWAKQLERGQFVPLKASDFEKGGGKGNRGSRSRKARKNR